MGPRGSSAQAVRRWLAASSLPLPRPWLSGSAAMAAGGLGASATGLPPPTRARASLPRSPLQQPSRRRRFPSGLGAGLGRGARDGAGRVGGVKVGAQQNPPHSAQCVQTVNRDLRTGGRAGLRENVVQSSSSPPRHLIDPSVEVSLHPGTREPLAPSHLSLGAGTAPGIPAALRSSSPAPALPRP